jgi:hypothetical protein
LLFSVFGFLQKDCKLLISYQLDLVQQEPNLALPKDTARTVLIVMIHGSNSNGNDRGRDAWGKNPLVSYHTKLQSKNYEKPCHSERSAAEGRISAALKQRFFAALRMTKQVF